MRNKLCGFWIPNLKWNRCGTESVPRQGVDICRRNCRPNYVAFFSPLIASADSCSFFFLSIYLLAFFVLGLFMYNFMWFIKLRAWAGMCWVCMGVQCTWVCARVRGCLHGCAWGFRPFRFGSPKLEWQSNLIVFNIGKSYVGAQNSDQTYYWFDFFSCVIIGLLT